MEQRRCVYILEVLRFDDACSLVSDKMTNLLRHNPKFEKKTVLSDVTNCSSSSQDLSPKTSVIGGRMNGLIALREVVTKKDSSIV